ncbi:MAG: serine hydrolase domain-containing protein [Pseudomonadota bacterium]
MALGNYVDVPRDLASITCIDHAAECDPAEAGLGARDIARIWAATEGLYRTGVHPAISLVIRRRGKVILKRSIGCLRGNAPGDTGEQIALTPDAPICLFSASKAITALLLHKLVEDGKLSLDDRVAQHIPEFAAHGKGAVTIRQLMAHRAGIPTLPVKHPDPSLLQHWDALVHLLCLAPPDDPKFMKQAYHALTVGFIVGELIRRVSGRELREVLRDTLTAPMQLDSMSFGLSPERRALSPLSYGTGPSPIWPVTQYAKRIIGVSFERAAQAANEEGFLSAVVPSGNIFASADDSCKVFQMLLDGGVWQGRRILKPQTVAEAIRPVGKLQYDGMLMLPMRFSAGFMLGESPFGLFGPRSHEAFGHLGFVSVLCWADPSRQLSVSLLNTGKSTSPTGVMKWLWLLSVINGVCA